MKISDIETVRATQTAPVAPAQPVASKLGAASAYGKSASPAAQVEFSAQAQAIAVAAVAVDAAPDTRSDLVAKLKAQVDAGTYQVSGKDIAEQMLRRAKVDSIR